MRAGWRCSWLTALAVLVFSVGPINTAKAESGPASSVSNLQDFVQEMNLQSLYETRGAGKALKIAVLDNDFDGYTQAISAKTLPASTQYHAGPFQPPAGYKDNHGLVMSEVLWGLLTNQGQLTSPTHELHLYRTYGYTNFKAAVDDIIARKIDVVLYPQNWEYGGNWDGHGFINAIVNRAIQAGVLWVNSTGDFGDTTYNAPIHAGNDSWVSLPDPNQSIELRCEAPQENGQNTCPLRLVLSWNDFKNDVNVGTTKDLDLVLTDDALNIVSASNLIQVDKMNGDRPGYSLYPREILVTDVKPGLYYVRVKMKSSNFTANDRLRISATGSFITIARHSEDESLAVPADNPNVIAVGASDTPKSSTSQSLGRPDISVNSKITLQSGEEYMGTSSASAAVAALVSLIKSEDPALARNAILDRARAQLQSSGYSSGNTPTTSPSGPFPLQMLQFGPTGNKGCFIQADPNALRSPQYIRNALAKGGTLVNTTTGLKIFYNSDPIPVLMNGIVRQQMDDIVTVGPIGIGLYPRSMQIQILQQGMIEAAQLPQGARICR